MFGVVLVHYGGSWGLGVLFGSVSTVIVGVWSISHQWLFCVEGFVQSCIADALFVS